MSSSCIEEVSVPNDDWYRIAAELLGRAGIEINGSAPSDLRVKNPLFFKRVLQEGSLGLGESYMDGWWECERLDIFFHKVLRAGLEKQLPHHFKDTLRIAGARLFNLQSKKRAWIVGKEHYDLGNDLFSRMLDPYMQYSCGYWKEAQSLEAAQQAKLDLICRKLELEPGMRVLDIGCGWGGLAEYMARNYQVSVVGVTISAEQQKMAQARCADLDVEIRLQDYRDLHDSFDRIVSVGMFEHVGPKNYATYFEVADRNLKPNGRFLLHTIGSKDLICRKLELEPGMRVLDIGCGWGGLAEYMARNYQVSVVGVTISAEQQKMAQARCADLDVEIRLQDYRDLHDSFDRIVSVGMFEHVGPKNYATYFEVADRNLKPNGRFLLHTIGSKVTDHNVDPWIDKYIFPNGCLPSVRHIAEASEKHFVMEDWHNFGADYDTTLMAWYERFLASWPEIADNYSERFKRMFTYYLNACAGAFRARDIQLWQVVFSRGIEHGLRVAR